MTTQTEKMEDLFEVIKKQIQFYHNADSLADSIHWLKQIRAKSQEINNEITELLEN